MCALYRTETQGTILFSTTVLSNKLKHKELSYLLSTELKHTELPHKYMTDFTYIPYINTLIAWKSSQEGKKIILPDQLPLTQTTKKFPSK